MKKNVQGKRHSRRSFLSLGLLGGASLVSNPADAMNPQSDDQELISMLTPDGKLVQVPRSVLEKSENRKQASNQDVLKWSESHIKPKD